MLSITYDLFTSQDEVLREEIAVPKPPGIELDFRNLYSILPTTGTSNNNNVLLQPPFNSFFYDIIREFWLNKDQGIKEQCNMIILGIGGEIMFAVFIIYYIVLFLCFFSLFFSSFFLLFLFFYSFYIPFLFFFY